MKHKIYQKETMKIYISGPISGYDIEERKRAFGRVGEMLLAVLRCEVVNPMEEQPEGWSWERYMERDLELLEGCDMMVQMRGWRESRGCRLEEQKAREIGMIVVELAEG